MEVRKPSENTSIKPIVTVESIKKGQPFIQPNYSSEDIFIKTDEENIVRLQDGYQIARASVSEWRNCEVKPVNGYFQITD